MAQLGQQGYPAARATGVCAATGAAIAPGDRYVATLVEPEPGADMIRQDFSDAAWSDGRRPPPPAQLVGSWRAVMRDQPAPAARLIDDAALCELFDSLDADSERAALRYLVALVLSRRRLVRLEPAGEGRLRAVWQRASGMTGDVELAEVADADELARATQQVGAVLFGEGVPR